MGVVSTIAAILTTTKYPTTAASTVTRYCGRYFGTSEATFKAASVCCKLFLKFLITLKIEMRNYV